MTSWEYGVLKVYRLGSQVDGAIWRGSQMQVNATMNVTAFLDRFLHDLGGQGWERAAENTSGPATRRVTEYIFRRAQP